MAQHTVQSLASTRVQSFGSLSCTTRRTPAAFKGVALHQSSRPDVSVATAPGAKGVVGVSPSFASEPCHSTDVVCRAVLLAEPDAAVAPTTNALGPSIGPSQGTSSRAPPLPVDNVDIAVIGADVAGLAVALAAARAQPEARVVLYDTASGPPTASDGGVLLSVNGQRALRALDKEMYGRLTSELAASVQEALWFDMEGELVRRTPLGQPSAAAVIGSTGRSPAAVSARRRSSSRSRGSAAPARPRGDAEPDPSAPPVVMGLHELREALSEVLPPEVEIFGRHHMRALESSPGGGALLHFAASPGGPPVRSVRAKLLVGADGPSSAVRRLQFDTAVDRPAAPAGDRTVWRGRFTLRQRDPDFARLRNFTTAVRTWIDLRAPAGSERTASLSPAGPNTFVWTASCPTGMLASRGLQGTGGAPPYLRCLAMFEDFPQDFFNALRATADNVVSEYTASRAPAPGTAAGLAAPWRWFNGSAALVGDAVYALPADDVSSTATNLALEDAAVLGACIAQYGMSSRALQEYGRLRGSRVSTMLAMPPSAPERLKLRDSPFLPPPTAVTPRSGTASSSAAHDTAPGAAGVGGAKPPSTGEGSLTAAASAAVDSAAAASATAVPLLQEVLAKAAAAAPSSLQGSPLLQGSPVLGPRDRFASESGSGEPAASSIGLSRPSGGASRSLPPAPDPAAMPAVPATPTAASSPLFSRPSGARRLGPVPAAIAAVMGLLVAGGSGGRASAVAAAAAAATSAARTGVTAATAAATAEAGPSPAAVNVPSSSKRPMLGVPYTAELSPCRVWEALLKSPRVPATTSGGSNAHAGMPALVTDGEAAAAQAASSGRSHRAPREYCSMDTPMAVWQGLLVAPQAAREVLVQDSYDAVESPPLVWMSLLGTHAAAEAGDQATTCRSSEPEVTTATTALPSIGSPSSPAAAAARDPHMLLPRPVLKQKPGPASAEEEVADVSAQEQQPHPLPVQPQHPLPQPQQQLTTPPSLQSSAGSGGRGRGDRRSARGGHHPKAGSAERRAVAGKGAPGKPRRSQQQPRNGAAATAASRARAAAKAAAKVTMSLSAAAALGGVISAGGGHMDMASALHVHGAVAQFWDDLNSLTTASLSSIDL